MRRITFIGILAAALLMEHSAFAQDEDLKECRNLGLEQLLQSFVLKEGQKVLTENLIAFCDDYGELKRDASSLAKAVKKQNKIIADLTSALDEAAENIETFRGQLGQVAIQLNAANKRLPPEGSILLVDNPGKCPAGWMDMAEEEPLFFSGRVVLAVGGTDYEYRGRGGSETHTLTQKEMPAHKHDIDIGTHTHGGDNKLAARGAEKVDLMASSIAGNDNNGPLGLAAPHNNMPPYIALYFCKKDSR